MEYNPSLLRVWFHCSPFFHSSFDSVIRIVRGLEVVPEQVSSNHLAGSSSPLSAQGQRILNCFIFAIRPEVAKTLFLRKVFVTDMAAAGKVVYERLS